MKNKPLQDKEKYKRNQSKTLQQRKTQATLRYALFEAQGISQFVIIVFVDVRGFSRFSKSHESPDVAMFLKRFYMELMDKYFQGASFFKPTGDGLLITFPYNDKTLLEVGKHVIEAIMQCLNEFPSMLQGDPMINFPVPENIGFGVARGTACCLYSGKTIIDYSGHLLNLAARLTELARPSGVVIDGGFKRDILPHDYRDRFEDAEIFILSLAENEPIPVFILKDSVKLPKHALQPIEEKRWMTHHRTFKVSELLKLGQYFRIELPFKANKQEPIKVSFEYPMMRKGRVVEGYSTIGTLKDIVYKIVFEHNETCIVIDFYAVYDVLKKRKVPRTRSVKFKIDYVAEEYP